MALDVLPVVDHGEEAEIREGHILDSSKVYLLKCH